MKHAPPSACPDYWTPSGIHHTAIIGPNVVISAGVYIGPYCVIGTHAESRNMVNEWTDEPGKVFIAKGTTIREFVTIHGGTKGTTIIGPDCYIQAHAHIGHDAHLHGNNTIACHAIVAGHVTLEEHAGMGLSAVTHQHAYIGRGAFLGACAFFKGTAEPFTIYGGVPAKAIGPNARLQARLATKDSEAG